MKKILSLLVHAASSLAVAVVIVPAFTAARLPFLVEGAAAQSAPPGGAFTLTVLGNSQVRLSWQPGSVGGFKLTRLTESGTTVLPLLGATDSSTLDTLAPGESFACYRLESLLGNGSAPSNILCATPHPATGSSPGSVSIRLIATQVCTPAPCVGGSIADTAVVNWPPLPGADGYVLRALRSGTAQLLMGSSTTALDFLGDDVPNQPVQMSCYVLSVLGPGGQVAGSSGVLCGMPQQGARL